MERDWAALVSHILGEFWKQYVINIVVNIAVNETISNSKVKNYIDEYIIYFETWWLLVLLDFDVDAIR